MVSSFRMLRSNSPDLALLQNSYLYGEPLPPFDVLFWNMDTTRMPQAMHPLLPARDVPQQQPDEARCADHRRRTDRPRPHHAALYAVTAEDDHIAPWRQCYRIRKYVNVGRLVRFVLSTSGHILGIVNPPVNPPKRSFWVGEPERNEHFEHWFDRAEQKPGSWWDDW